MPDYIARSDNDFLPWIQAFQSGAAAHGTALGLTTAADLDALGAAVIAFQNALGDLNIKQQVAQASRAAKDVARDALETMVRAMVRRIQAHPAMTDEWRAELGITVRDATRTAVSAANVGSDGLGRPQGAVDTSDRLRHEISFRDESNSSSRAKPKGVMGCEIWVKVGDTPPKDPSECTFVALDTASPYMAEYTGADAGKTAYYLLRWVTSRGEKGPWSEPVQATVVAL